MLTRIYFLMLFTIIPIFLFSQTFTKVTSGKIVNTLSDSRSVNWIDYNNDGFQDLMITNGPKDGENNMLYKNLANGSFEEVLGDPIVMDHMPSDGATWADMDNDGYIDCFVVNWYNKNNMFYKNNGDGSFTQIKTGPLVTDGGYSETAAWGDYDNDGLVDLYVTNSAGNNKNFLYHNNGGGTFTKITTGALVTDGHISRSINWTDLDNDGDLDVFVTNESAQNEDMYKNNGAGNFEHITTGPLYINGGNTMSSSFADFDNDGWQDVFLANDQGYLALFRNTGDGDFIKLTNDTIAKTIGRSFGSNWGDIDNDGDLDLFVTNAFGPQLQNFLFINKGDGTFTRDVSNTITKDTGWSYGCAFGDYDNDGFLDLAVANCYNAAQVNSVFHNNGNANHWLEIKCIGIKSNKSAIGAKIKLKAIINGKTVWQLREISAQSGYNGQNMLTTHFGLGADGHIDSIIILWPSGMIDIYTNIGKDKILTAYEGQSLSSINDKNQATNVALFSYPNPFKNDTTIEFDIPETSHIDLEIYDMKGNLVKSLLKHTQCQGKQLLHWDGRNNSTNKVDSGIYLLVLKDQNHTMTQKINLVR